jgi:hypothetical protein
MPDPAHIILHYLTLNFRSAAQIVSQKPRTRSQCFMLANERKLQASEGAERTSPLLCALQMLLGSAQMAITSVFCMGIKSRPTVTHLSISPIIGALWQRQYEQNTGVCASRFFQRTAAALLVWPGLGAMSCSPQPDRGRTGGTG